MLGDARSCFDKSAPSVAGKAATLGAILYKSKGCGDVIPAGVQGQRPCPTFSALKSTVNSRIGCSLCRKREINTVQCVNTAVCDESLFLLGAGGEDDPLRDIDGVVADALEIFCCHEHIHRALAVLVFLVHHAREFAFDGGK